MNKIFKRITASVMAVTTLAVSMVGMSANAVDNLRSSKERDSSVYLSQEEQYEIFLNSDYATPEKIKEYKEMMNEHRDILNGASIQPRATSICLGIPYYEQKNGYYCGPASVRQVCGYLNGENNLPNQDDIAKAMGTTSDGTEQSAIINYLNKHCNVTYKPLWKGGYKSPTELFNLVISNMGKNKPIIAHIKVTNTSDWLYTTNGHYLCFDGFTDDTTTNGHVIKIVDPWFKGHHLQDGRYSLSRETVYKVTDRIAY